MAYISTFLADPAEKPNVQRNLYEEAIAAGYLVNQEDGSPYPIAITDFDASLVDLTNPDARQWLKDIIRDNLIGSGFSGWMADFGEYLPTDAVLHSGEKAEDFHNKYPVIWAKTVYEALKESGKLGDIVYFTRSGYSHVSKYTPLVWAGDQLVNWSMDDATQQDEL